MLFISCVCHAFLSVHCCLVVTWRERAEFLTLVCDFHCDFVTFPFGILGQVRYLIVSIPDPWFLTYLALAMHIAYKLCIALNALLRAVPP